MNRYRNNSVKMLAVILFTFFSVNSHSEFLQIDFDISGYQEIRSYSGNHPLQKKFRDSLEGQVAGTYFTLQWVNNSQRLANKNPHYCIPFGDVSINTEEILSDLDNEIKNNPNYHPKMKFTDALVKLIMRRNPCQ